ncbi:DM13 domain-containing protein [Dermatobacter hominis]|uniref:DM13 domain-containing protein n=1 Tax=Dermatobacter hominis TaxID=2884263 RepID=UPI001D12E45F|nr:DM13 domain-containing protein [Dermatobacter hominis]UDY34510.1 DM13 domain-containing protein [Dermatobacter hominis]
MRRIRPRTWLIAGGIVLLGLGVFAFLQFRPDLLFIDRVVDEPLAPDVAAALQSTDTGTAPTGPGAAIVLARGEWESLRHSTSGDVAIVRTDDGPVLAFDELRGDNGPDLHVYLSPAEPSDDADFLRGAVKVGGLKGNIGTQSYALPDDLDPSEFRSVVIWCDRFSVPFGAAELQAA